MIRIEATIDGKTLVLEAKSLSDMTVGDLSALIRSEDDTDAATYAKFLGIDEATLSGLSSYALTSIEDAYLKAMKELADERAKDPEPLKRVYPFDGEDWAIPQDVDKEVTIGQLLSLENDLKGCHNEIEAIPYIFAHLCTEQASKVAGNVERFKGLPAIDGVRYAAFFLTSSERLRNAMHRVSMRYLSYKAQALQRELTALRNDGEHGEPSSPLQGTQGFLGKSSDHQVTELYPGTSFGKP